MSVTYSGFADQAHQPAAGEERTARDGSLPVAESLSRFVRDQEIYREDAQAKVFFRVVTGVVRTFRFHASGSRRIDAFYVTGEVFGLEAGATYCLSAAAVCDSTLIAYRRQDLERRAAVSVALSRHLFVHAMHCATRARDHALLLGSGDATEKVASFLMEWAGHSPDEPLLTLKMTRGDIADYLGLAVETVSRILAKLKRDMIIGMPKARHIRLIDPAGLRALTS